MVDEALEHLQQDLNVQRVQADARFIEDKQRPALRLAHVAGQAQALGLAAGQRRGALAEVQVTQPHIV